MKDPKDNETLELFGDGLHTSSALSDGLTTSSPEPATASAPRRENDGLFTSSLYAVDPGQREGSTILSPDGIVSVQDFLEFVKTLKAGDVICTETTAHVYRPKDRRELLEAAEAQGVEIWGMRSIHTSKARLKTLGTKKKGSDADDALAIRYAFNTKPELFYRLRPTPVRLGTINEVGTPRFELNRRLVALRRENYPGYKDLHAATIAVAAQVALEFGLSSRGFDRLCGFHGSGYPNLTRSNRNKHGAGKKAELRGEKLKVYRQAARAFYKSLRATACTPRRENDGLNTSSPSEEFS